MLTVSILITSIFPISTSTGLEHFRHGIIGFGVETGLLLIDPPISSLAKLPLVLLGALLSDIVDPSHHLAYVI
jgi:hypothetical protein